MRVRLGDLTTDTIFSINGRCYRIGGASGPIRRSDESGQWELCNHSTPDDGRTQGLRCKQKLGGEWQDKTSLQVWFPMDEEVEVEGT